MSRRAIFLDKDGTLVDDVPYNVEPILIRLARGAANALPLLRREGYRLIVVSNQSGVALRKFSESRLAGVRRRLDELCRDVGASLDGFYYCPHPPEDARGAFACGCRKPQPGLLQRAALEEDLDLSRSWMVGDILNDVEAGRRAGCRTILLDNGHETKWKDSPFRRPHFRAPDLGEAAAMILEADRSRLKLKGRRP